MSELKKIQLPKYLVELAEKLPVDLYVVGGKVRNHIMNIDNDDIDLCSSFTLEELEEFLKKTDFELKFKNTTLGTAKLIYDGKSFDYATLRKEIYEDGGNRQPKTVQFIDSIEEDYLRRDFSINAIYYNIRTEQFFDFCDGIRDIAKRTIRCVRKPNEVLADDGLRILRMVRISAELNFKINKDTYNSALKNISNLNHISGVNIAKEMIKICDASFVGVCDKKAYLKGIKLLNKMKAWRYFGVNFDKLKTNMVKKDIRKYIGLLIDIVDSEKPASISYFLNKVLDQLQINKKKKEEIINVISGYYDALNRIPNKIYFSKYFDNFESILEIINLKSKSLAQRYNFFYKYIISHKVVVRIADLKISYRDIANNFPSLPKKSYDVVLNMVLSDIFEGKYNNDKETILKEIEKKMKYY